MNRYGRLRELEADRNKLLEDSRAAHTALEAAIEADSTNESIPELRTKFDGLVSDAEKVETEIREIQADLDREQRMRDLEGREIIIRDPNAPNIDGTANQSGFRLPDGTLDVANAEYRTAFLHMLVGADMDAEMRNVLDEYRDMNSGTGNQGGYLVPEMMLDIYNHMKFVGPMVPGGGVVRELPTDFTDNIVIPTIDDVANTGAASAENAAVTSQDPTVGEITLGATLVTSKFIKISDKMMRLSNAANIATILNENLGERLGKFSNTRFTTDATHGIVGGASAGITTSSGTTITSDEILELKYSVDRYHRQQPGFGFQMNDDTVKACRLLKNTATGTYLFSNTGDLLSGEPDLLDRNPLWVNNDMTKIPSSASANNHVMLAGNMRAYTLRVAGGVNLVRARERFIDNLQVGYMAYIYLDGKVVDSSAIKRMTMKPS